MAAITATDVLIVGAGSAGLMAAVCAAAYGMNVRIIDKRPYKLDAGHGDGLHARMLEVLDGFGLADIYVQQGNTFTRTFTWTPDRSGKLVRQDDLAGHWNPPSVYTSTTLSQAKTSNILLEYVEKNSTLKIERSKRLEAISVNSGEEYAVTAQVRRLTGQEDASFTASVNNIRLEENVERLERLESTGEDREIIKAKYIVACDGAHSLIRQKLNIPMIGSDTDVIWGVLDIRPVTDFPGTRFLNSIVGSGAGLLWIPREDGMVRIYCVLASAKTDAAGKLIRSSVTADTILKAANDIMHPYTISYRFCEWWAAYQIGQRVTRQNIDESGRIFLTGDAVHTHSPQAGQGMNVSMADAFNLMWKLNLVLKGVASSELLQTYREERLPLAQQLVDFDRSFAAIMSGKPPPPAPEDTQATGMSVENIGRAYQLVIQGLHILYPPSGVTLSSPDGISRAQTYFEKGELPPGIVTGMRMPSYLVTKHSDLSTTYLGKWLKFNGRFKLIIFAGNVSQAPRMQRLNRLCAKVWELTQTLKAFDSLLTPILETIVVHTADPLRMDVLHFPALCYPVKPDLDYDYDKVFSAQETHDRFGQKIVSAYQRYGIDPKIGRTVLLRPDGYVAYQGSLEDFKPVQAYFQSLGARSSALDGVSDTKAS